MCRKNPYIIWFQDNTSNSLLKVGAKNASLGEMTRVGIPVPSGFAVTTKAYKHFIAHAGITEDIKRALSEVSIQDIVSLEKASQKIRPVIESASIPSRIKESITISYQTLAKKCNVAVLPVAIRSSSNTEDLPSASFAGQHETFLGVRGADEVLEKFKMCISSLFTPQAISYRAKVGFSHDKVSISVCVQKMVNAKTSGVMFTLNPVNGDPSKIIIEANWGLGETVVSGKVTPDLYIVDKTTFEILERRISQKRFECVVEQNTGEVVSLDVPLGRQKTSSLSDEEILELVQLAKLIERHYARPQDMEWAIDKDMQFPKNILILQSRPETVWSQKKRAGIEGGRK